MAYRLRVGRRDLVLAGELVVGRGTGCGLLLDDPLVSRRHARFYVDGGAVKVEDLGSRNGVSVGGVRLQGPTRLRHLSRVTVGTTEIVLLEVADRHRARRPTSQGQLCLDCGKPPPLGAERCPDCTTPPSTEVELPPTLERTLPDLSEDAPVEPTEATERASAFALLGPLVDKALRMGQREGGAIELVSGKLEALLAELRGGRRSAPHIVAQASMVALRLAEGLEAPAQIDRLLRLNAAARRVLPSEDVDRLHRLIRAMGYRGPRELRAYLEVLRARTDLTPSERFAMRRIEGLAQMLAA